MSTGAWIAILISAACTLGMRALPFLLFREGRPMPEWLARLGRMLPAAVMAVLVVYCLRDGLTHPMENGLAQALGVAVVCVSYRWKHSTFLSILLGTTAFMLVLHL